MNEEDLSTMRQAMDNIVSSLELIENKLVDLEDTDSIELGSPTKGGKVKVYGNAARPQEFRDKIQTILDLKFYAETYEIKKEEGVAISTLADLYGVDEDDITEALATLKGASDE